MTYDGRLLSGVTVLAAVIEAGTIVGASEALGLTRSAVSGGAAIEASGSANIVRGRLRVNVDPFFSRIFLSSHIATFLARYPEISLELIMRDAVGDLVADGCDL